MVAEGGFGSFLTAELKVWAVLGRFFFTEGEIVVEGGGLEEFVSKRETLFVSSIKAR